MCRRPLRSVQGLVTEGRRGGDPAVAVSTDNVFGDDKAIHQLATVTGSVKKGFTANLTIGI